MCMYIYVCTNDEEMCDGRGEERDVRWEVGEGVCNQVMYESEREGGREVCMRVK